MTREEVISKLDNQLTSGEYPTLVEMDRDMSKGNERLMKTTWAVDYSRGTMEQYIRDSFANKPQEKNGEETVSAFNALPPVDPKDVESVPAGKPGDIAPSWKNRVDGAKIPTENIVASAGPTTTVPPETRAALQPGMAARAKTDTVLNKKIQDAVDALASGMTDAEKRHFDVPLDFLGEGSYEITLYCDGPDADYKTRPDSYIIEKKIVNAKDSLPVTLASGGGFAASFRKI